jgi:hypothetical protein
VAISHLHFEPGQETFIAVSAGAFLAAVAGFAANQVELRLHRAERERGAALLFGEIIAGLRLIIEVMQSMHGHGDPWGPVTLRMARAAQRELHTYERNRESLFQLRDPVVRARIHTLFVRLGIAVDGVIEATARIEAFEPDAAGAQERLRLRLEEREGAYRFVLQLVSEMGPILAALKSTAGYDFEHHETTIRSDLGMTARGADAKAGGTAGGLAPDPG